MAVDSKFSNDFGKPEAGSFGNDASPIVKNDSMPSTKETSTISEDQEHLTSALGSHLRTLWGVAFNAKSQHIEPRLARCKRAIRMEYETSKLAAIKKLFGADFDPPYRPIILGKYRDTIAWTEDYLCREDVDIWDITPTPLPDLPGNMMQQVQESSQKEAFAMLAQLSFRQGNPLPVEMIPLYAKKLIPRLKDKAMREIKEQAREAVSRMKTRMKDQLAEGGFEKAKKEAISDLAMYPNAFIQGPCVNMVKVQKRVLNEITGKWESIVDIKAAETFRRVSPWMVFNQPDAKSIEDGYVFILDNSTPTDMSDMLDLPDEYGVDKEAVRKVIRAYRSGGLKEWTNSETTKAQLEDRDTVIDQDGFIDKLEYQGSASGKMLKEWAGSDEAAIKIFEQELDDEKEYQIIAWLVGSHVIKAILNPDPLGKKNLYTASIIDDPDNFWSPSSLPEMLLKSVQNPANAAAIALVYNTGISSGSMMEYNKDRFPDGVAPSFHPGAKWPSTGAQMQSEKIVNFYDAPFHGDKMIMLDRHYMDLADLYSGIPRHTNDGPKQTATAESIKATQASQGLKSVLVKWDIGIMDPLINKLYQHDLQYEDDIDLIGDCTIIAKGAQSVIVKEQLALRRTEYADKVFSNQYRMQILGPKGLRELEKANAQPLDMDLDKLFGEDDIAQEMAEIMPQKPGMQPVAAGAMPGMQPVQTQPSSAVPQPNGAGDAEGGQDFALAGKA